MKSNVIRILIVIFVGAVIWLHGNGSKFFIREYLRVNARRFVIDRSSVQVRSSARRPAFQSVYDDFSERLGRFGSPDVLSVRSAARSS